MSPFVRKSKVRHLFGTLRKKEQCYDGIRITRSGYESTFCSVNKKFLAVVIESAGGGAFIVLPLEQTGRVDATAPVVAGHKAAVLDVQWCPYNDNLIASSSEDCTVKVWEIPDEGLSSGGNITEPVANLAEHQRRVCFVVWHPTVELMLLSAGADNKAFLWNVRQQSVLREFEFPDFLLCAQFNLNGTRLVTSCKDKMVRIIDIRSTEVIKEGKCHEGTKPQQCVYLKDGRILTTGFSRMSERQLAIWNEDNLETPLQLEELDTSNGTLYIHYDGDLNVAYLCGKGDVQIRYFEITPTEPYLHFINILSTGEPQRGIAWLNKQSLDINSNEVARCYKINQKGHCDIISFTIPRKSEKFQEDLYPDTLSLQAAQTVEEWEGGKDAEPIMMSLAASRKENKADVSLLKPIPRNRNSPNGSTSADNGMITTPDSANVQIKGLHDKIEDLQILVEKLQERIETLEQKV